MTPSTAADRTIGVRLHGVSLNLSCNDAELLDYVMRLMPGLCGPPAQPADLSVRALWHAGPCEPGTSLLPDPSSSMGLGKRMHIGDDELLWFNTHRDKSLQLRFRRGGEGIAFDVAYRYQPTAKKLAKYPDYKYKKFFDLLRYLVHFPIAWHAERTRGWSLLHASAVAAGDRAVLIGGPGGAGKTTTCLGLLARNGMRLLTENLLFTDGSLIYGLPEPIRLTDDSLALLGEGFDGLEPVELPGGLKDKTMYWLPEPPRLDPARAAILFIPQFSSRGFVRRIAPDVVGEQLWAVNRLTLELNDYYWYTAALDLLWPKPANARGQLEVLERLAANTPCYHLGIDRSAGVGPVVDQILACLERPPDGAPAGSAPRAEPQAAGGRDARAGGRLPVRYLTGEALMPDEASEGQLRRMAALPGLTGEIVVLPDVHCKVRNPTPTGTVIVSSEVLVPRAIDEGVGCGIRALSFPFPAKSLSGNLLDELFTRLIDEMPLKMRERPVLADADCEEVLLRGMSKLAEVLELPEGEIERVENHGRMMSHLDPASLRDALTPGLIRSAVRKGNASLGTIGAGNHFLELQEIVEVLEPVAARRLGLEQGHAVVMMHSDSRRLGKKVMRPVMEELAEAFRPEDGADELWTVPLASDPGRRCVAALAASVHAGFVNRALVTHFLEGILKPLIGPSCPRLRLLFDCAHESIQREEHDGREVWVHRHGASHALPPASFEDDPFLAGIGQPVPVPGSMGSDSYLAVTGAGVSRSYHSVAHGAGRVVEKDDAAVRYDPEQVESEMRGRGIRLYRYGADDIAGQAPWSFKSSREVVQAMARFDLLRPVVRLRPLAVLKG